MDDRAVDIEIEWLSGGAVPGEPAGGRQPRLAAALGLAAVVLVVLIAALGGGSGGQDADSRVDEISAAPAADVSARRYVLETAAATGSLQWADLPTLLKADAGWDHLPLLLDRG